ncbi:Apoptogenic protein 1 [Porites harrisoni]
MKSICRNKASVQWCTKKYLLYTSAVGPKRWRSDGCGHSCGKVTENATSAVSPFHSKFNLVGPRDYKSNIRKVIYAKSKDENASEKRFREQQQDLNAWHQVFWEKHNDKFTKSKKAYLKLRSRDTETETSKELADDLSKFYRDFLDGNYQVHTKYLRAWYHRNFQLLWAGLQVSTSKFISKIIPWKSR